MLDNEFCIPLDFGIFKQPVYHFGLYSLLKVKLVFNSAENIILANFCLEFYKNTDIDYAAKMRYRYNSIMGYRYPYDRIICEHYNLF